jgi:hypothetical protein
VRNKPQAGAGYAQAQPGLQQTWLLKLELHASSGSDPAGWTARRPVSGRKLLMNGSPQHCADLTLPVESGVSARLIRWRLKLQWENRADVAGTGFSCRDRTHQ